MQDVKQNVKQIVILISGRGSNMEAIVRACRAEGWNARISAVVSNRADAAGLLFAQWHGIATAVVEHSEFSTRAAFDGALAQTVESFGAHILVLAGFMRILGDDFVARHAGRMINIHPSLLPAFPGLHTHQRAIDAGCKVAGATVHLVTSTLDVGPIVAQAVVPVLANDTAETLAARVLQREHEIYPRAVRWLVDDLLQVEGGIVRHRHGEPQLLL